MTPPRKAARPGVSTLSVRGGITDGPDADEPVVTPLHQSTSYVQEFGSAEGLRYPRYGNTPNAETVQRRIAALEGAEAALVLASGMGATACALLALLRPGDHLLASAWIYGGTHRLLTEEFATLIIDDSLPRGAVVVRDIAGIAPTEIVRVVKPDLDRGRQKEWYA